MRLCDIHKKFVDAATMEASREVWSGAIHVSAEAHDQIEELLADKYKAAGNLGVRLYREALQKRCKP